MTPRLTQAIYFMKVAHRSIDQRRRDGVRLYEVHPLDVMDRVSKVTEDEDILIAALFHDILEDVVPKRPEYFQRTRREAGFRAWGFILALTDKFTKENYPNKNRKARKQLERERYARMSPEAKLIKLADIASNLSDVADDDAGFMGMFVREKEKCLPYLLAASNDKNVNLYLEAMRILDAQKKRLAIR